MGEVGRICYNAIPSCPFGCIERLIGVLDKFVGLGESCVFRGGDTDADALVEFLLAYNNRCLQYHLSYSFGYNLRFGETAIRHDDKEFVAAASTDCVIRAEMNFDSVYNFPKYFIAEKMSVGIVNGFELIQIENGYADFRLLSG